MGVKRATGSGRWWVAVLVIAAVAFVFAIAIQRNIFPLYSGDHDEPVYVFQAQMLADGDLTLPGSQNEFFRPWLSGPRGDRLVMAFQPLWPAVLMVADKVTGSMLPALGLAAASAVFATYFFALEILRKTSRAAIAAALFAVSPFVLMLGGTYLNYVFAVALGTAFYALALRALRTTSRVVALFAGGTWGAIVLTRPFDALLYALPIIGYAIATRKRDGAKLALVARWAFCGTLPLLVVVVASNIAINGGPFTFSTTVSSGGASAFGFGYRALAPDAHGLDFTPGYSITALGSNLWALPKWLFGTYLAMGLAIFGGFKLWRRDRSTTSLLLAMTFIFPIGYMAWWASAMTILGAANGLGPHYYLPMMPPLAVLMTYGLLELHTWRRVAVPIALLAMFIVTLFAMPTKLDDKRFVAETSKDYAREVRRGLAQRGGQQALVTLEGKRAPYVMDPRPFLTNSPDLSDDILYAVDRGARNIDLIDRYKERRAYRLVSELPMGAEFERMPVQVRRQSVARGTSITFDTTVTNNNGSPVVIAYLCRGQKIDRQLLDMDSRKGERYRLQWTLEPDAITFEGPSERPLGAEPSSTRHGRCGPARSDTLALGASFGAAIATPDPVRAEWRTYGRTSKGTSGEVVEILTAPDQWIRFGGTIHSWLPADVRNDLSVEVEDHQS